MTGRSTKYFKNIDALRFYAFMLVFISHMFFTNNTSINKYLIPIHDVLAPYAFVGISFFFTLSSFLITWIVLSEYDMDGAFDLKNFYIKRALRIWPLYFLIVFMVYILVTGLSLFMNEKSNNLPSLLWFVFFVFNFYLEHVNANTLFLLVFLWTISVEEQFYLLWGIVLRFFKHNLYSIIALLLVLYLIAMILLSQKTIAFGYFNTINYVINFSMGALLAIISYNRSTAFYYLKNIPTSFWKLFYLIFLVFLIFFQEYKVSVFEHANRQIIFSLFFCLIIFNQCFTGTPLFNIGRFKLINYLGKISYGLYCWHGVIITFILKMAVFAQYSENTWDVFVWFPLMALVLTIFISIASYRLYEAKFLKLKQYFSGAINN